MPTWPYFLPSWLKNSRSPRRSSATLTRRVAERCCTVLCGSETPACRKLYCTRPLQSKPAGVEPPYLYGLPTIFAASAAARSLGAALLGLVEPLDAAGADRGVDAQPAKASAKMRIKAFTHSILLPRCESLL